MVIVPFLLSRKSGGLSLKRGGNAILLLGLCESGKTALFTRLKNGEMAKTVVSMVKNDETFPLSGPEKSSRNYHVIDFPGHHRLREGLPKLFPQARAIIFMIDSNAEPAKIRQSAEFLYNLLTNPIINKNGTSILIACNKSDLVTANSVEKITKDIEAELNELRSSKTATPGAAEKEDEVFLGIEGEKISLKQLPLPITFTTCSVKANKIDGILDFVKIRKKLGRQFSQRKKTQKPVWLKHVKYAWRIFVREFSTDVCL